MSFLEGFQNQALAFGALLASVPLVIHLLNRQRHRPMPWAAMRFVLAAYKRTRRRSQLENLLLLFLRMAAVALLALALARPFTSSESPLVGLTEKRRDLVLVVDTSASTGYRETVDTVFDRILARAREHILALRAERGDRLRLFSADGAPEPLSWRSPEDGLSMLTTLTEASDEAMDLRAVLTEIVRLGEAEEKTGLGAGQLEVRILCDLQRETFVAGVRPPAEASASAEGAEPGAGDVHPLDRLEQWGVRVLVEDLGSPVLVPQNLGIVSVRTVGTMLGPGLPTEIGVTVRNHGPSTVSGVRMGLSVDGERQPSRTIEIPARDEVEEVFPVVFATSGHHVVEARVAGDGLAIDDVRHEVVLVPPKLSVLLVNGDPHPEIERDEVGFLRAVLEPIDESAFDAGFAPFEPTVVAPEVIGTDEFELRAHDVIFLANVEGVSAHGVERLEDFVSNGGALVVTLGDRVVPENYNSRLFRSDGTGLLPCELVRRVEVRDRREDYFRAGTFDTEHPIFAFFAEDRWRPLFGEVPIYAFFATVPLEGTRVLARLDDEAHSPLLMEREYDRGRVLCWTTSIDPGWTRLPESPKSLVPFVHELVRHAGRPRTPPRSAPIGRPIALEVESFPRAPTLLQPDGTARPLEGEPVDVGGGRWRLPALPELGEVGLWRVETLDESLDIAIQFDPVEGDLARITPEELASLHKALVPISGDSGSDAEGDETTHSGELWRGFARFCLAVLILESLWAGFVGRRRRWTP